MLNLLALLVHTNKYLASCYVLNLLALLVGTKAQILTQKALLAALQRVASEAGGGDAQGGKSGGGDDGDEHSGWRGWELLPNGRVAHLRGHVEEMALGMGYEIEAVGDGPIRWQVHTHTHARTHTDRQADRHARTRTH